METASPGYTRKQQALIHAAHHLAEVCQYEASHSQQVTRLALRLFDELQPIHRLGLTERAWLECAGLLHDVGWLEGQKSHHKISLRIILETELLPFSNKERLVIGSIARYHRRALPSIEHDHFAALTDEERAVVVPLAGCLRLADGMDFSHQSRVIDLTCKINDSRILIRGVLTQSSPEDAFAAIKKSDLLELALNRRIKFRWIEQAEED